MNLLLVDKRLFPLELLEFGPVLLESKQGHIQVEKLPEVADEE